MPTLTEVLAIVPPSATVYVEIKGTGIELLVADVIGRSSAHCAVHSFDHGTIERFKQIAPDVPRGLLFEGNAAQLDVEVQRIGAREIWPHYSLVDADLVARARALGAADDRVDGERRRRGAPSRGARRRRHMHRRRQAPRRDRAEDVGLDEISEKEML